MDWHLHWWLIGPVHHTIHVYHMTDNKLCLMTKIWWKHHAVQASSQVKYIPRISTEQAIITGIVLSPLMALGPHVDSKLDSDIIQYQKSPHIFLTHVTFTICIQYQKSPRILFGYIGSICNRGKDKIQTLYL